MLRPVNLLLLASVRTIDCDEILAATMPQGQSHVGSMVPLLDELVQQGHNVTIYMEQFGELIDFGPRLKKWYINVTESPPSFGFEKFEKEIWHQNFDPVMMLNSFKISSATCGYVTAASRVEMERIAAYPWDLILTDSLFTACGYGIALLSKANHVIMHTSTVEEFHALTKKYGRQYAIAPPYFMDSWNPEFNVRNFFNRFGVIYEVVLMWLMFGTVASNLMGGSLSSVVPDFDYSTYSGSAVLSFTDMPLQLYVPEPINNELFGYGAYCKPFVKLHGELVDFVDDSRSNGTILMAFGTILPFNDAPRELLEAFVDALNQLTDYRIIWACRGCPEMKLAEHVRVLKWVPQMDLLNHPKTKLLITHGGLKSLKEAACSRMPTLFMPMFGDQVRNAWLAKYHGFGQIINKLNVTSSHLLNIIREMLNNPSYRIRAEKMRSYFEDAPMPAVKEGAFWMNRLLKYGGRLPDYFYTRSTNSSYIRHLNFDLILMIPAVICGLLMTK